MAVHLQESASSANDEGAGFVRPWLSPMPTRGLERISYAIVGIILVLVSFGGFAIGVMAYLIGAPAFIAFGLLIGLPALILGYRMLVAAATGRRLYWWPGQRAYDQRQTSP